LRPDLCWTGAFSNRTARQRTHSGEGGLLLTLDGAALAGTDDLIRLLDAGKIGRAIELGVLRNGRIDHVTLVPRERRAWK